MIPVDEFEQWWCAYLDAESIPDYNWREYYAARRAWFASAEFYERLKSDPCKDGFCPVELFRPIDETEGSN